MKFDVISLFPDYFESPLSLSILKKAVDNGLLTFNFLDLRNFGNGRWLKVDDAPFGGGGGMVIGPEPVAAAIRSVKKPQDGSRVIYLSPRGSVLNASKCRELALYDHLILICGHYEGIDQRVIDLEVDEEISIGDYVLTAGSAAALVLMDAVSRFVPGVLGNPTGSDTESFENGLLEYPQYTRPESFEGLSVPSVLLSGNHKDIHSWRLKESLKKTEEIRPDLYLDYLLSNERGSEEHIGTSLIYRNSVFETVIPVEDISESLRFYSGVFGLLKQDVERYTGEEQCGVIAPNAFGRFRLKRVSSKNGMVFFISFEEVESLQKAIKRWNKYSKMIAFRREENNEDIYEARFEDLNEHHWVLFLKNQDK
ncbi:MAG: tRNA (guanosine(37)-N1)-methyltransferase TrmD [Victivallaceae bacterium]